ncbi:MAG TPA: 7TM diverse intracellular signaling domain-containing protein, partial [Nevskia sp.]|nr:7TM diverse intracellular signaling domain-containing protein [Nevskia sp.]
MLLACALLLAAAARADGGVLQIRSALFLPGESATPPLAQTPGWQSRKLPDDWSFSQPGQGGVGWYRAGFELAAVPDRLWAVYVPRLRMNAAVYVNGRFVGDGGRFDEPVARNWNRPLYFLIPAELLQAGSNTLDLRVTGSANVHAGLFGLEAGPDAELRPSYERRYFLKVTLNQALFVATLLMAALMGMLWLRRRQDSIYGWFALVSLLWAAHSTHFFVRDLPLTTWQWEWFAQASTDWFAVLLAVLVHRYYGLRRVRLERLMLAYAAVSAAVLACFSLEHMFAVANTLHFGAVLIGAYVLLLAAHRAWLQPRSDEIVLAIGFGAQSALGLHDWLLQLGVWDQNHWYLMHYGSSGLFLVIAWLLSSRFVRSLGET